MVPMAKQVYTFGKDSVEGNGSMVSLLGGKGAGLAEMTLLSVPVPQGSRSPPTFAATISSKRNCQSS